jgi:hypothetical protein
MRARVSHPCAVVLLAAVSLPQLAFSPSGLVVEWRALACRVRGRLLSSSTFRKFSRCNSSCCLILLVHAVVASGPVRRSPERALCLCSSTGVLAVSSPSEVDQPWPFPFALSLVASSPVRSSPERALCPCSLIDAAWFVNSLASPIVAFSPVLFPSGCALCPCSLIVVARSLTLRTVSWHPAQCSSLSGVLCALAR